MNDIEFKNLEERMKRLEELLLEINSKIENFLGYEELNQEEEEEVERITKEMKEGKYVKFEEIFK